MGCRARSRRLAVRNVVPVALLDLGNPRLAFGNVSFLFWIVRVWFFAVVYILHVNGRALTPVDDDVLGSVVSGAVEKDVRAVDAAQVDRGQMVVVPVHIPFALLGFAFFLASRSLASRFQLSMIGCILLRSR